MHKSTMEIERAKERGRKKKEKKENRLKCKDCWFETDPYWSIHHINDKK